MPNIGEGAYCLRHEWYAFTWKQGVILAFYQESEYRILLGEMG